MLLLLTSMLGCGVPQLDATLHHRNAVALRKDGQFAEAEAEARKGRAAMIEANGETHWTVASETQILAWTISPQAGREDEAIALHERAIAIFEADPGPFPEKRLTATNNLAMLHLQLGNTDAARPLLCSALQMIAAIDGTASARFRDYRAGAEQSVGLRDCPI